MLMILPNVAAHSVTSLTSHLRLLMVSVQTSQSLRCLLWPIPPTPFLPRIHSSPLADVQSLSMTHLKSVGTVAPRGRLLSSARDRAHSPSVPLPSVVHLNLGIPPGYPPISTKPPITLFAAIFSQLHCFHSFLNGLLSNSRILSFRGAW